jgi:hypothetical protein
MFIQTCLIRLTSPTGRTDTKEHPLLISPLTIPQAALPLHRPVYPFHPTPDLTVPQ